MHLFIKQACRFSPKRPIYFSLRNSFSISNIDSKKDYYKILGVTNKATESEIKKSYYQLAKKYHPDVNQGKSDKIKEVNEAYEVLGDANKRKEYDDIRKYESQQQAYANNSNNSSYRPQPNASPYSYTNYSGQNPYNRQNEQKYYYYEVKTDKGTYKKSFKQEGPFSNQQNFHQNNMGLNEEILKEFMKTIYNQQTQNNQNPNRKYANVNRNNFYSAHKADSDEFMRQQGFRKDPFTYDYEDYKAYESRREEEMKRQREFERLQREKHVCYYIISYFMIFKEKFLNDVKQGYEQVKSKIDSVSKDFENITQVL